MMESIQRVGNMYMYVLKQNNQVLICTWERSLRIGLMVIEYKTIVISNNGAQVSTTWLHCWSHVRDLLTLVGTYCFRNQLICNQNGVTTQCFPQVKKERGGDIIFP